MFTGHTDLEVGLARDYLRFLKIEFELITQPVWQRGADNEIIETRDEFLVVVWKRRRRRSIRPRIIHNMFILTHCCNFCRSSVILSLFKKLNKNILDDSLVAWLLHTAIAEICFYHQKLQLSVITFMSNIISSYIYTLRSPSSTLHRNVILVTPSQIISTKRCLIFEMQKILAIK